MTTTEIMPRLVVGYTELGGGKWKKGKGFLKPNFGVGPKQKLLVVAPLQKPKNDVGEVAGGIGDRKAL